MKHELVKKHYDEHLGRIYSWMSGDFSEAKDRFLNLLTALKCSGSGEYKTALDLGAGHGVQSAVLAGLGYAVTAVDFNDRLLDELRHNCAGLGVTEVNADIMAYTKFGDRKFDTILCTGDTITHLESDAEVQEFLQNCRELLADEGRLILGYRDLSDKKQNADRFIPVRSDDKRILTCFLEYFDNHIQVHDIFHENTGKGWVLKVSSYPKLILEESYLQGLITKAGLYIHAMHKDGGMTHIVCTK